MPRYSIEPRTGKYVKGYGFLSFARNLLNKYRKKLSDAVLNALKTASKKVFHKVAGATGEFIGDKLQIKLWKKTLTLMKIQQMLKK